MNVPSPQSSGPAWLRLLPAGLRQRLTGRAGLHAVLHNTGWLMADKLLRLGLGLLVSVWIARYLGPRQFGLLNYALAIVTLIGSVASAGLNDIVVRDLVQQPQDAGATLGSAFAIQTVGGSLSWLAALLAVALARPGDALMLACVAVLGATLALRSAEVVKYAFEAKVNSKYAVWVENAVFLLLTAARVALVLSQAPLMAFVWMMALESLLTFVGLLAIYGWRGGRLAGWRVRVGRVRALLRDGWPLALSSLAIMVYMRIDQLMLGLMLGEEAVGLYTAAVRVSEAWYFVPLAIVASVFPTIIETRQREHALYMARLQRLYNLLAMLALVVAVPMSFISPWLVTRLYGPSYAGAGMVLAIHIWAGLFVSLGVASSRWLVLQGLQRGILLRTVLGAVMNIALNLVLIPFHGVTGAAVATVISYGLAVFAVGLHPQSRLAFTMMARALLPFARHPTP